MPAKQTLPYWSPAAGETGTSFNSGNKTWFTLRSEKTQARRDFPGQAAWAALEASLYETIRCSPSSQRQQRKHARMS